MARQPAHRRQVGAGANKSLSKREYRRHLTALELELNNVARRLQTTGRERSQWYFHRYVPHLRPLARWCCSTAAVTTARGSNA